jgi:nitrogen fixation-related uncharacterized protein
MSHKQPKSIAILIIMIGVLALISLLDYSFTKWGLENTNFEELNPIAKSIIYDSPQYLKFYKVLTTFSCLGIAVAVYFKCPKRGRILIWILFIIDMSLMIYWYLFFTEFGLY